VALTFPKVQFLNATFQGRAYFFDASFQSDPEFRAVIFHDTADFVGATFEQPLQFGPLLARKQLNLDDTTFRQRVQIRTAAATVCAKRARRSSDVVSVSAAYRGNAGGARGPGPVVRPPGWRAAGARAGRWRLGKRRQPRR
jgi:hypothetical protein